MPEPQAPAAPKYGFASAEAADFPSMIILENTTVCNLRCIHCPQGNGWPQSEHYHAIYMDWDVYKKAIDEIAANKITLLRFGAAGDSTVHPQILDQVAYAKAKGISPLNLTTNGLILDNPAIENGKRLPNKTMLDRLLDHRIDIIDISLDAASRERYEKIRVGSDYYRVWSNIYRLLYLRRKLNAPTKVMLSIVDQPEAHDEVEDFVKHWKPLVDRVIVRGYLQNLGLTPAKSSAMVDQVKGMERWPCPQFWKRITISPDGSIRFCVVDWNDRSALGNIKTHSIKELWQGAEYERLRKAHLEGRFNEAHAICGPCTDWMGMRWEWGYELAVGAVTKGEKVPDAPPPL